MANPQTLEHLQQALDCAGFVVNDIRAALGSCDRVAWMILAPLLDQATAVRSTLDNLRFGMLEGGVETPASDTSDAAATASPDAAAIKWSGTPAPWRAIKTGSEDAPEWIVLGGPLDRVVAGFPDVDGANAARVAADAKLIAAAPALLSIALDVVAICDDPRLQRNVQELTKTLQLPRHVLVPLELLDGLADYADQYRDMMNTDPPDDECRGKVRAAREIIRAARRCL